MKENKIKIEDKKKKMYQVIAGYKCVVAIHHNIKKST
jgi:hypothetical protein